MARISKCRQRLGQGSYADHEMTVWEARCAFLEAVYDVQPATYWSLFPHEPGEAAYEAYRERWGDNPGAMVEWWQKYWHLPDAWLADIAMNTLRSRLRFFINGQTAVWQSASRVRSGLFVTPNPRKLRARHGHVLGIPFVELYWNPTEETRAEARGRLRATIDSELDRVEKETALAPTRAKSPEHFVWLARYQVLGQSGQEIAKTLPVRNPKRDMIPEQAARRVQLAINDTKDLIGLKLRDDPYRTTKKTPSK